MLEWGARFLTIRTGCPRSLAFGDRGIRLPAPVPKCEGPAAPSTGLEEVTETVEPSLFLTRDPGVDAVAQDVER
jgi:hypothetical protein